MGRQALFISTSQVDLLEILERSARSDWSCFDRISTGGLSDVSGDSSSTSNIQTIGDVSSCACPGIEDCLCESDSNKLATEANAPKFCDMACYRRSAKVVEESYNGGSSSSLTMPYSFHASQSSEQREMAPTAAKDRKISLGPMDVQSEGLSSSVTIDKGAADFPKKLNRGASEHRIRHQCAEAGGFAKVKRWVEPFVKISKNRKTAKSLTAVRTRPASSCRTIRAGSIDCASPIPPASLMANENVSFVHTQRSNSLLTLPRKSLSACDSFDDLLNEQCQEFDLDKLLIHNKMDDMNIAPARSPSVKNYQASRRPTKRTAWSNEEQTTDYNLQNTAETSSEHLGLCSMKYATKSLAAVENLRTEDLGRFHSNQMSETSKKTLKCGNKAIDLLSSNMFRNGLRDGYLKGEDDPSHGRDSKPWWTGIKECSLVRNHPYSCHPDKSPETVKEITSRHHNGFFHNPSFTKYSGRRHWQSS